MAGQVEPQGEHIDVGSAVPVQLLRAGACRTLGLEAMMNETRGHYSYSQINMYQRCPNQYMFRYPMGIKAQPTGTLALGRSFHEAEGENYLQKIDSHEDMTEADVLDIYDTAFEGQVDLTNWQDDKPGEIKDVGVGLVKVYHKEIAPIVQPVEVEEYIDVPLDGFPKDFVVRPDVIDDNDYILDLKTSAKSPANGALDRDLQPTAEALGYRAKFGKEEAGIRFDYAVKTKEPKVVSVETRRTDKDISAFMWLIGRVHEAIEREAFYPTDPTSWQCSEKWCGYFNLCEGGGKRVERKIFT